MNCPKCGAKRITDVGWDGYQLFECLSHVYKTGQPLRESDQCLRNQLATVTAERDALKADQSDWRKGVAFIASALGEKDPPDLSCVRLALLAAEVTAERDALLEACKESLIVLALNGSLIVDPRHAITLVESAIAKCDPATAENGAGE